jgi:hypothetical protein
LRERSTSSLNHETITRYGTLDQFKDEPHDYAAAVMLGISPSCENAVVQMLVDICRKGTLRLPPPPHRLVSAHGLVTNTPSFFLFSLSLVFSLFSLR